MVKQFGVIVVNVYNLVKFVIEIIVVMVQKFSSFIEWNKEVLILLIVVVGVGVVVFGLYCVGVVVVIVVKVVWMVVIIVVIIVSVVFCVVIVFLMGFIGLVIVVIGFLVGVGVVFYCNWDEVVFWVYKMWNQIKGIVENVINGVMFYLCGVDMKGVGFDIVQGLVNGILVGLCLVFVVVCNLGSKVIEGVKGVFNIQLFFCVMKELGEFMGQGFVMGLEFEVLSVCKVVEVIVKVFLDLFSDLKLEWLVGNVDFIIYICMLEQVVVQLCSKFKIVQEGIFVYVVWFKVFQIVMSELDVVKSKSSGVQVLVKGFVDELICNC